LDRDGSSGKLDFSYLAKSGLDCNSGPTKRGLDCDDGSGSLDLADPAQRWLDCNCSGREISCSVVKGSSHGNIQMLPCVGSSDGVPLPFLCFSFFLF